MSEINALDGMASRHMWRTRAKEPRMNKAKIGILLGITLLTTACGHVGPELDGYHEGWRRATVLEVGQGEALRAVDPAEDCRAGWGADASRARFAVTSYALGGNVNLRKNRIVAVSDNFTGQAGDQVAINVKDCRLALRSITTDGAHR